MEERQIFFFYLDVVVQPQMFWLLLTRDERA
jgi:hypothetical protein